MLFSRLFCISFVMSSSGCRQALSELNRSRLCIWARSVHDRQALSVIWLVEWLLARYVQYRQALSVVILQLVKL